MQYVYPSAREPAEEPATRRRSPSYVRAMSDREVHAIAGRFVRLQRLQDLSAAQEWLLEACFSELAYRRRTTRPIWRSCSCQLCVEPF